MPDAPSIHPTAAVSERAELAPGVTIGPRCVIDGPAVIGANTTLLSDVHIHADVHIGADSTVYPFACIGYGPQHVKFRHDDPNGGVRIGDGAVIREHATIHAAMEPGAHTTIGERIYLMVAAHVGHDCTVGDDVIVCNNALLAGHCRADDRVYISGNVAIHQFCRIGVGAMLAGNAVCNADVPPYCTLVAANMLGGLNLVGMRRAGIPRDQIALARRAYSEVFRRRRQRDEQLEILDRYAERCEPAARMGEFVRTTKRGVLSGDGRPRPHTLNWLRAMLRPEAWSERAAEIEEAREPDGVA